MAETPYPQSVDDAIAQVCVAATDLNVGDALDAGTHRAGMRWTHTGCWTNGADDRHRERRRRRCGVLVARVQTR